MNALWLVINQFREVQGARVTQGGERSPPTNVAEVQLPASTDSVEFIAVSIIFWLHSPYGY